jgi:hypothetical protein
MVVLPGLLVLNRSKGSGPADQPVRKPSDRVRVSFREAAMCAQRSEQAITTAGSGSDQPLRFLRPSSLPEGTYGCEKHHNLLIVAGHNGQNGNKALQIKEIGQNKKKRAGRSGAGIARNSAFPRVSRGRRWSEMGVLACKTSASGSQKRPNTVGALSERVKPLSPCRLSITQC